MTDRLTVRLRVPVGSSGRPGRLTFTRWFPESDKGIEVEHDGLKVRIWFDEKCLGIFEELEELQLEKQVNLWADRIGVDVVVPDAPTEFVEDLQDRGDGQVREGLEEQYEALGRRVYSAAVAVTNRVLHFVRSEKGQHWVRPFEPDPRNLGSFNVASNAKVVFPAGEIRWMPPPRGGHSVVGGVQPERYLSEPEWQDLAEFLESGRGTNLLLDLLADAEELRAEGYDRGALVTAVTALEVAIVRFVANPNEERLNLDPLRISIGKLPNARKELGLRRSVDILIPLLLSEEDLTDRTIDACAAAVHERNTVVHQGQRAVDDTDLRNYLSALRTMVETLDDLTVWP